MEPTPPPADPTSQPLVEYVRTSRQNAGYGFLSLSVLFLALTGWATLQAARAPAADPARDKAAEKALDPLNPEKAETKVADPNTGHYIVAAIGGGLLFLVTAAAGVWLVARPPLPGEAQQRTEAREVLLATGGLIGMILIVLGVAFFYLWAGSLTAWLDKGETKEAWRVLIPLLLVVGGAGLAFISIQPARAEERHNSAIRRLVYGTNLGLSVLLLFVALVVANVAIGRKLPNKLDTTESGFYSISTATTEFLTRLDQPATAYAVLSGQTRASEDTRRLLQAFADVPGTKFRVRLISPTQNKGEYTNLKGRYPVLEANEFGVLLTYGEDERRHSFIREDEFTDRERAEPGQPGGARTFVAESRIMRELQFLAENQQKAVVYFTQSAGELSVADRAAETAAATRLKAYLERNYLDVRPLKFDANDPKVPDDATVLVVIEPRTPLPDAAVAAVRKYMTTQVLPDNRKGKLVVMAGARFGPDGKVTRTGLEELLAEFGVRLTNQALYAMPTREWSEVESVVGITLQAVQARNRVAESLGEKFMIAARNWRVVEPAPPGAGEFRGLTLLITEPGRPTWVETEQPPNVSVAWAELRNPQVRVAKQFTEDPRSVAVLASQGEAGRVAVFGNGMMVSDAAFRGTSETPVTFELVTATIDWLRDRPSLGIGAEAKKYKTYTFPATTDETRVLWLPLLLSLLLVGGAGAGVWVVRRK